MATLQNGTSQASAVMFDFSGTLMRVESVADWLNGVLESTGIEMSQPQLDRCATLLEEAGALPGGAKPREIPEGLRELWHTSDLSSREHRTVYTALARQVPLPKPELYDALYDRHMSPDAWQPYPDTAEVLRTLHAHGVPVAVVSNIGWDLRPVFRAHGLDPYISAYVLSFEHGVQKPESRLFRVACEALGSAPEDTLMVGDDERTDGGATRIGCAVRMVRHLPVGERPAGLLSALEGAWRPRVGTREAGGGGANPGRDGAG
ncbi:MULTISPECIES: HAD family hydrolase [unclassified Streptomyces]|uniref:HAD family hydrolase n=1 Tax=unclassified Streptomyces TaxID=2593676 RepID=UPI002DD84160|nr:MULTISPECIES: HAD family hydrolase [unclassified Streptomyces]WSA90316.1 HAD family hydrolase [Streptomyces sp. NBC_01795]WSS17074.1 HAD family hydrolase [Streptomyces sp. NBC_01186]WSS45817.1 HAD family hydrolase [Streptomyces sp. NBC_01187]